MMVCYITGRFTYLLIYLMILGPRH